MVVIPAVDADERVARFRTEVLPRLVERYRPTTVLVFGSRARGEAHAYSDLDVLIVSPAFQSIPWLERRGHIRQECGVPADVELLCYAPEEYGRKVEELGIVRTATREGVDLLGGPPRRVSEPGRAGPGQVRAWLAQADRDVEQAQASQRTGHHEWACFAAQQGAEKAVKALHLQLDREGWGHAVARLLEQLPATVAVSEELVAAAKELDDFYIGTRYPNSHAAGAPFEHYGASESDKAIRHAQEIVAFVRARVGRPSPRP